MYVRHEAGGWWRHSGEHVYACRSNGSEASRLLPNAVRAWSRLTMPWQRGDVEGMLQGLDMCKGMHLAAVHDCLCDVAKSAEELGDIVLVCAIW